MIIPTRKNIRKYRFRKEAEKNTSRWVLSYADFITLLFAFFVVMYAMSSVNEGKYNILSSAMDLAFHQKQNKYTYRFEGGLLKQVATPFPQAAVPYPVIPKVDIVESDLALLGMKSKIQKVFSDLIDHEMIVLNSSDDWLEIELKSNLLFKSGLAVTQDEAKNILHRLAKIVSNFKNPIRIEGYTDNVPIQTDLYPSNWELSASRAASVVRELIDAGVSPRRLAAVGFGEQFPKADNTTEEGRLKNRRVLVVISREDNRHPVNIVSFDKQEVKTKSVSKSADTVSKNRFNPLDPVRLPSGGIRFSIKNKQNQEIKQ